MEVLLNINGPWPKRQAIGAALHKVFDGHAKDLFDGF